MTMYRSINSITYSYDTTHLLIVRNRERSRYLGVGKTYPTSIQSKMLGKKHYFFSLLTYLYIKIMPFAC